MLLHPLDESRGRSVGGAGHEGEGEDDLGEHLELFGGRQTGEKEAGIQSREMVRKGYEMSGC